MVCAVAWGQKPEFEFYTEFRNVFIPKVRAENPAVTNEEIIQRYAASLREQGIPNSEIKRRLALIQTERQALEIDVWNRVYTTRNPEFNQAPNAFLMQMVDRRTPGVALDYAMGEGRIYLAQLGWEVWGFDQAEIAVALAQKRAKQLGLTLKTSAVRDADYDFGKERFDLILFSWSMPLVPIDRVIDSLKPGDGSHGMRCQLCWAQRHAQDVRCSPDHAL